jgi:hypothetical protein
MRTTSAQQADVRDRAHALLDRVPGWRRVDDVPLPGSDADHVIATPVGLLVVVAARGENDLALAAAAGRRVRRMVSLPPNAIDVPVHAAVLVWGAGTGWDDAQGVYVLDGERPGTWPAELTAPLPADLERQACDTGEALRKVRGWAAYHQRRTGPRTLASVLRRGLSLQRRVAVRA